MKKTVKIGVLIACMIFPVSIWATELREGMYIVKAPALFNAGEGRSNDLLCRLKTEPDHYVLLFLSNEINYGASIAFTLNKGKIKFDPEKSNISMSEIWREISGSGKVHGSAHASGKLKVSMGAIGFLLMKNKSSEWSLRPATRIEVLDSYAKGLKMAQSSLRWAPHGTEIDDDTELLSAIRKGVKCGYHYTDVPIIMEMIKKGDIVRDGNQLYFKEEFLESACRESPLAKPTNISTNVVIELIDMRDMNEQPKHPVDTDVCTDEIEPEKGRLGITIPLVLGGIIAGFLVVVSIAIVARKKQSAAK
jgi:hypothetical protein